ncbi:MULTISPECIES: polysaccharide ABC transporter ATP-binding protein [Methylomonas]|uniref:ABC transporter ATP-binding protein n=1 Tax=Methylomonas TaxID=416 RepID=UPI0009EE7506|nr:polysaccharide ABC transporter ATP-binding protein [Methylomonas koyamae]
MPAIKVENLGKKYNISQDSQARYSTLRDKLSHNTKKLAYRFRHPFQALPKIETEEFWALKDINFEIRQGDRVGIIGRNGAGKSTLLKILSRITAPTTGKVIINGRVASLLEVGTGFHPELTGRENIFLNGAILGMRKYEIQRKFDEIVDFAEVEKFIDTPVKHYSSGMHVRLAFAVAAHLEPEILIVDEVLAVGDAEFQKKCLGKMEDVSKRDGRIVLFVSHNMNAIQALCDRVIFLDEGRLDLDTNEVRRASLIYLGLDKQNQLEWINPNPELSTLPVVPLILSIRKEDGTPITGTIANNEQAVIELELELRTTDPSLTLGYAIYTQEGQLLYWSYQTDQAQSAWPIMKLGRMRLCTPLPMHLLNEGNYRLEHISSLHCREWILAPGIGPSINISIQGGLSESPLWQVCRPGILAPVLPWFTHADMSASINDTNFA